MLDILTAEGNVTEALSEAFSSPQKGISKAVSVLFQVIQNQAIQIKELQQHVGLPSSVEAITNQVENVDDDNDPVPRTIETRVNQLEKRLHALPDNVRRLSRAVLSSTSSSDNLPSSSSSSSGFHRSRSMAEDVRRVVVAEQQQAEGEEEGKKMHESEYAGEEKPADEQEEGRSPAAAPMVEEHPLKAVLDASFLPASSSSISTSNIEEMLTVIKLDLAKALGVQQEVIENSQMVDDLMTQVQGLKAQFGLAISTVTTTIRPPVQGEERGAGGGGEVKDRVPIRSSITVEPVVSRGSRSHGSSHQKLEDIMNMLEGLETNVQGLLPYVEQRLKEMKSLVEDGVKGKVLTELKEMGLLIDGEGSSLKRQQGPYETEASILALLSPALHASKQSLNEVQAKVQSLEEILETRTTTEDVESIVKHNNAEMAARINTAKNVLEQQVEILTQSKIDKTSVKHLLYTLEQQLLQQMKAQVEQAKNAAAEAEDAYRTRIESNQYLLQNVEERIQELGRRVETLPPAVSREDLLYETEIRENAIKEALEQQMNKIGVRVEDLAKVTGKLDTIPTEQQVRDMFIKLDTALRQAVGNSEATAAVLQSLKFEVKKKATREDVLSLVLSRLEDMTRPRRPASNLGGGGGGFDRGSSEDGLMLGKVQYRCLGCNQPAPVMHGSIEKVVHDALAPLPSTMAPEERKRQKRLLQQQYNQQLILATYPNGRGGALKSLHPSHTPHVPIVSPGTGPTTDPLPASPLLINNNNHYHHPKEDPDSGSSKVRTKLPRRPATVAHFGQKRSSATNEGSKDLIVGGGGITRRDINSR